MVAFVWELTKESINFPLGCLQGGAVTAVSVEDAADRVVLDQHGRPSTLNPQPSTLNPKH